MRRVASPKARTTPYWRNCTADTLWVHTHAWKHILHTCTQRCIHTLPGRHSQRQKKRPISLHQNSLTPAFTTHLRLPQRGKHPSWQMNRLVPLAQHWTSVWHLHMPRSHSHMQTQQYGNVISHSAGLISIVCKKIKRVFYDWCEKQETKLRTAWPLREVSALTTEVSVSCHATDMFTSSLVDYLISCLTEK